MIAFRTVTRFVAAVFLATASFALPACKGSNSPTSSGRVATFAPENGTPGLNSIALLAGTTSGANIDIRVTVTGVNQFLGAAFHITYNTTALQFNGMSSTDSFLRPLPPDHEVPSSDLLFLENHTTPGDIVITATRVVDLNLPPADGGPVGPVDVTITSDLVVLNFTAHQAIAASTDDGLLAFGDPKQVCDGTIGPLGCGTIAVSWSGGKIAAQ